VLLLDESRKGQGRLVVLGTNKEVMTLCYENTLRLLISTRMTNSLLFFVVGTNLALGGLETAGETSRWRRPQILSGPDSCAQDTASLKFSPHSQRGFCLGRRKNIFDILENLYVLLNLGGGL